jgi:hypothetical protein
MTDFLKDIVQVEFSANEYIKEAAPKKQIYLHHTAGNSSGVSVFRNWDADSRGRIATCVCISGKGAKEGNGTIVQGFSSKYWAYHLGAKRDIFEAHDVAYQNLDKISIGIEICAWGQLTEKGGKFYNYVNREVAKEDVCTLEDPYKRYQHFHRYTDEQIRSVENLLKYWNEIYDIPLIYREEDMWDVSLSALKGEPGVYTHNSIRKDKIDIFPQPEMIEMLKSL